ncbi:MAG: hypothetical protein JXR96_23925 [Deltaproteobacteria bacterium]|nr:hypothetical protein [Deltaproteobacteria bacterium]
MSSSVSLRDSGPRDDERADMVGKLVIPEAHHRPLEVLLSLREDQYDALAQALAKAPPVLQPHDLVPAIPVDVIPSDSDRLGVVGVLTSLYIVYVRRGIEKEELAADVCSSIEALESSRMRPASGSFDAFKKFLSDIFSLDSTLGASSKALDLMSSHERCYSTARITSDLRPVFPSEPEKKPVASVVFHTLEVEYFSGNSRGLKTWFVAMDIDDLRQLRDVVNRAISKHDSLRDLSEEAGVPCLGVEHEC